MKTTIFAVVLSAASIISASAQEVLNFNANYGFTFIPSCLMANGKSVPVAVNMDPEDHTLTASIMDDDLNVVKQFKVSGTHVYTRRYEEKAFVKPSGVEIEYYDKESDFQYTGEQVTATDMNSLVKKMSEIYEGRQFYGFTDLKGNVSCYSSDLSDFYMQHFFGNAYPQDYFSIIDGIVYRIWARYTPTISQADLDNAEWTYVQTQMESSGPSHCVRINYYNSDANIFYDRYCYVSQTLFNEDDKWEYILPMYGPVKKIIGDPYVVGSYDETGIRYSRIVEEKPEFVGIGIYDEDGKLIASASFDAYFDGYFLYEFDVFVSNGNTYLVTSSSDKAVCIKYDRSTSSIKEVSQFKSNAPLISMDGRKILVGADGKNIDEAVLYDMGGHRIASSRRMSGKNISINAANVAGGVYNVALKNKGKVTGAQKIIIK